jgi:hypothetical protein
MDSGVTQQGEEGYSTRGTRILNRGITRETGMLNKGNRGINIGNMDTQQEEQGY